MSSPPNTSKTTREAETNAGADIGAAPRHFIQQIIDHDIKEGTWGSAGDASVVRTRFPPEPNGFLHIGHAKSICLNFGLATEFGGRCILRFDDTNPTKEEQAYVESIVRDVRWLGFRWDGMDDGLLDGVRFASDYFAQMHAWAVELIEKGVAYVDDQSPAEIREARGTPSTPGTPSPGRSRSIEENLDLFARMTAGEVADGSMVLRAKIDLASPNFNLRDPVMYRVLRARHHRTGDAWCVYPMYDWAHGLEDSIEGITHSICTLEFEDHRPLYDWFIDRINDGRASGGAAPDGPIHHPQQIEFARLNPTYTMTSKRKLRQLVEDGHVTEWDDPRMPTLGGMRRRGYTPEAIRAFCDGLGVTKFKAVHDIGLLENAARAHLNRVAPRRMAVLRPLKVVITNWAEDSVEWLDAVNNPEDESAGTRAVPFTRELFIERDDFMEDPPRKFFRLGVGREVRLRYGYWITCSHVVKNDAGEIVEVHATYDPQTRGGNSPPPDADGKTRKVKGTLHWVSADHAVDAEVRLFDRLFTAEDPNKPTEDAGARAEGDTSSPDEAFIRALNPNSCDVIERAKLELNWAVDEHSASGHTSHWHDGVERFQFERIGYFCVDQDSTAERPVFNRTVTLKDSRPKSAKK